jgi:hypothetical protein
MEFAFIFGNQYIRGLAPMNLPRPEAGQRRDSVRLAIFSLALFAGAVSGVLASAGVTLGDDCTKFSKEVIRLRAEYRETARNASQTDSSVGFDELTAILDKIVDAKRRMRDLGCGEAKKSHKKHF